MTGWRPQVRGPRQAPGRRRRRRHRRLRRLRLPHRRGPMDTSRSTRWPRTAVDRLRIREDPGLGGASLGTLAEGVDQLRVGGPGSGRRLRVVPHRLPWVTERVRLHHADPYGSVRLPDLDRLGCCAGARWRSVADSRNDRLPDLAQPRDDRRLRLRGSDILGISPVLAMKCVRSSGSTPRFRRRPASGVRAASIPAIWGGSAAISDMSTSCSMKQLDSLVRTTAGD